MQPSIAQIAEAFTRGNYEITYPYMDDTIQWNIVGDKLLIGKEIVIGFCNRISASFAGVATRFDVRNIIENGNKLAINGTNRFINKEHKSTIVSSSDVYLFEKGKLLEVTSYCIKMNSVGAVSRAEETGCGWLGRNGLAYGLGISKAI